MVESHLNDFIIFNVFIRQAHFTRSTGHNYEKNIVSVQFIEANLCLAPGLCHLVYVESPVRKLIHLVTH